MSRVHAPGSISWTASDSPDVVGYRVYVDANGDGISYDDPCVDVGNVTSVTLPVEGLPAAPEGLALYGVSSLDAAGNESDIAQVEVTVDITPPSPPSNLVFSPSR